jgi:hypothetical protein
MRQKVKNRGKMYIHKQPFLLKDGVLFRKEAGRPAGQIEMLNRFVVAVQAEMVSWPQGRWEAEEPHISYTFKEQGHTDTLADEEVTRFCVKEDPQVGLKLCQELIRAGFTAEEILLIQEVCT